MVQLKQHVLQEIGLQSVLALALLVLQAFTAQHLQVGLLLVIQSKNSTQLAQLPLAQLFLVMQNIQRIHRLPLLRLVRLQQQQLETCFVLRAQRVIGAVVELKLHALQQQVQLKRLVILTLHALQVLQEVLVLTLN